MSLQDFTTHELMGELKRRGVNSAEYAQFLHPPTLPTCVFCGRQAADLWNGGQRGYRCKWTTGCVADVTAKLTNT